MQPNTTSDQSQASLPVPQVNPGGAANAPNPQPLVNADVPTGVPISPPQSTSVQQAASAVSPSNADDIDVIEKEWVIRAKSIISKTKDDPSAQSKELGKYKADYIKKRFNKDVKTSEG